MAMLNSVNNNNIVNIDKDSSKNNQNLSASNDRSNKNKNNNKIDIFDPMLNQSTNYFVKFFKLNKLISPTFQRISNSNDDNDKPNLPESLFEDFAFELFLLTQFNVHYLSWIKKPACHQHYMDRLPIFCKKISKLIQVQQSKPNHSNGDNQHKKHREKTEQTRLETWNLHKPLLIAKSIQEAFKYQRVVNIKFLDISGLEYFSNKKKVLIVISDDNSDGGGSNSRDGSGSIVDDCNDEGDNDTVAENKLGKLELKQDGETQDRVTVKDEHKPEKINDHFNSNDWHDVNKALEDSDFYNDDDDDDDDDSEDREYDQTKCQPPKSRTGNKNSWLNKLKSLVQARCCDNSDVDTEQDSDCKQSEKNISIKQQQQSDKALLAQFEMNNQDTICLVPFPDNSRFSDKEYYIQIKLVDIDSDQSGSVVGSGTKSKKSKDQPNPHDPDNQIIISFYECTIGGFSGLSKNFSYQLNADDRDMVFKFRIELKWQINEESYFEENSMLEPFLVPICSKFAASLFLLDSFYFWHFYRSFYMAMCRHPDESIRIVAIEIFKEIAIGFNSASIQRELVPTFVQMYNLPYPTRQEIEISEHYPKYKPEHLSILENIIFIFHYLNPTNQMNYIKRLAPHCMELIEYNAIWFKRILHHVKQNMGCYELEDIERTIVPMASSLMHCLDSVTESIDNPDSLPNWWWPTINGLASLAVGLAVESIDCLKPIHWINCKITDPAMRPIHRSLQLLVDQLLKPVGYRFLETFYNRLHNNQILNQEQLLPFLNKKRIEKFYRFINNKNDQGENDCESDYNVDTTTDSTDSDNVGSDYDSPL